MALRLKVKNYAKGELLGGFWAAATSFVLKAGQGVRFPAVGSGNPFRGVFWAADRATPLGDPNREIVECFRSVDDTFTIVAPRGREGTTARDWSAGDNFALVLSEGVFGEVEAALPVSILTTQGDIIIRGAAAPIRLPVGTAAQFLKGGTQPAWGAIAAGDLPVHPHAAGDITSGIFGIVRGGTGADTAAGARTNLGAAASGINTDITALQGLNTQNALQLLPFGTLAGQTGEARFRELAANGVNFVGLKAPDALAADNVYTLPSSFPSVAGQALVSSTAGVMSWAAMAVELDFWLTFAATPAVVFGGGSLTWTGGNHIFALRGANTTDFWRYSISGNTWDTMTTAPAAVAFGGSLTWTGGDHIFAFRGNSTTDFWRYSISGNTWNTMTAAPAAVDTGSSLTWTGGDHIFTFRGNNTTDFWRYSISGNTWDTMTAAPAAVWFGGSLTWTGGNHIFAFRGTDFWRYSISGNTWNTMTAAPAAVDTGSSLTWTGGNHIFAFRGNNTTTFWRYSISGNTWDTMTAAPAAVFGGGSLARVITRGINRIFALRGANTTDFWRYNI